MSDTRLLFKFGGGLNPDALQDVPTRGRGATGLIPERPEETTATGARGHRRFLCGKGHACRRIQTAGISQEGA